MSPGVTKKNRIILGMMTMGPEGTSGARIKTVEETRQILHTFHSLGYDEIDTARMYCAGQQEYYTSEAGYQEIGMKIATKIYPIEAGSHAPERLRQTFHESLAALKTDHVDILYLHAPDRSIPFETTLEALDVLHREGRFTTLGLSNFCAFEVAEIATVARERGWVRPGVYQGMYNGITRAIELELVPVCRKWGIDIVIYNPVGGGLFSGKYKPNEIPKEGRFSDVSENFSDDLAKQGKLYRQRYLQQPQYEAIAYLTPIVKRHGLTLIESALRWCLHHSALRLDRSDGIIIGCSSEQQLKDNIRDLEKGPLSEDVVRAMDEAWLIAKSNCPNYFRPDQVKYDYIDYD